MSQPFVPGPVPIFVNNFGTILFLGFSEGGVNIDFDPTYSPYNVDFGGSVPLDYSYQGTNATISAELTNWNEEVYALISDYASSVVNGFRGLEPFGYIGTLMGFEGATTQLWLPFPYQAKIAYRSMPVGYHFFAVFLDRDSLPQRGAKPAKLNLTWRAIRSYVNLSPTGVIGDSFLALYDHDMSSVAGNIFDLAKK